MPRSTVFCDECATYYYSNQAHYCGSKERNSSNWTDSQKSNYDYEQRKKNESEEEYLRMLATEKSQKDYW